MVMRRILYGFGGAAASGFSPSDLTSYVDHLIDDGLDHSGGTISRWVGETGAVVVTQDTASKEPAIALSDLNGHNVVNPDGVDDWLGSDQAGGVFSTALTQPFTVYTLEQQRAATSDMVFARSSDNGLICYGNTSNQVVVSAGGGSKTASVGVDGSWRRYVYHIDGASSWATKDGGSHVGFTGSPGANGLSNLRIFNWSSNSLYHGGKMAVMVFQNGAPTSQEESDMDVWLTSYGGL